jgi:hypothetical protein
LNTTHRIALTRTECNAIHRNSSNPLKGLSKSKARQVAEWIKKTHWEGDMALSQEVNGSGLGYHLELISHGREFKAWLPLNATRKIDRMAGGLGLPGGFLVQQLLEEAVDSPTALENARKALKN